MHKPLRAFFPAVGDNSSQTSQPARFASFPEPDPNANLATITAGQTLFASFAVCELSSPPRTPENYSSPAERPPRPPLADTPLVTLRARNAIVVDPRQEL